jgi:hypothetical protein
LRCYLRGRQLTGREIEGALMCVATPVTLTKRGALIWGRKRAGTQSAYNARLPEKSTKKEEELDRCALLPFQSE